MSVPASRPEGHRTLVRLGVAAALGVLLGLALIAPRRATTSASGLQLYGELLPSSSDAVDAAVERAERHLTGWFNLELPDGSQRRLRYADLGVTLDRSRFQRIVRDTSSAADGRAPRAGPIVLVVPVLLARERVLATLLALKQALDQPPLDARFDLDSRAVIPERAGRRLDVDRSLAAIEEAVERGAPSAPLSFESEAPARRARELDGVRYDVLLGAFETPFDRRAADRVFNMALAASKLDGYVLMPGALFDFNAVVGPREEGAGYRVAAVVAAGERVDGGGSGTSQISGTLHAAALFAGLDVVERHPPERPGAVEIGLDAAVAYPLINLRLKNPYDFPVVLRQTVAHGRVRAEVRGPERPHSISVLRALDRMTPFPELERDDATLERGIRLVAQRGVPGIDLHRYRIRSAGAHAVREVLRDHYPASAQLVRVGTGARSSIANTSSVSAPKAWDASTAGRPPLDESSLELPVGEVLVLSQSNDPDAPLRQQRFAGRSTVPNGSKDIGAPAWFFEPGRAPESLSSPRVGDFLKP